MRLLFGWVFLISLILFAFYYADSKLEKTILVNKMIKLSESDDNVVYSVKKSLSENEVYDLTLNKNSEVILISGKDIANKENIEKILRVKIDRPEKNVILVLKSENKITWDITTTSRTNIDLIIYDGYNSDVLSNGEIFKYKTNLDLVLDVENVSFIKLLNFIKELTSINKLSFFYSEVNLPDYIEVTKLQNEEQLSLSYLSSAELDVNFEFELLSKDNKILDFDLNGPQNEDLHMEKIAFNSILSPNRKKVYKIIKNGLKIIDLETEAEILKPVPAVRTIFNPRGLAYDTLSDMVYLANKRGKFYVFDADRQIWVSIRKYIDDYDINSLSYDEESNIYISSTWKEEGLVFFDQKGNLGEEHSLKGKLKGLNYYYKEGEEVPRLEVISRGNDIAIILIKDFVQKIWYYNKLERKAILTYNYYNK